MGFDALGALAEQQFEQSARPWSAFHRPLTVKTGASLFPRIEAEKPPETKPTPAPKAKPAKESTMEAQAPANELLDISEFARLDLRVAEVVEASRVEGADKLLKLKVNLGSETRQIVAGIAQHYAPEELIGKRIVVVANLKPATLRGVESLGMLLAASDEQTVSILTPVKDVAVGSKVK